MNKAEASADSKAARRRRRLNAHMVQNVLLIWLDSNIDEESTDCHNTLTRLRRAINNINTFTDSEECIQFIKDITDNKACMIISGSLGQSIVPRVHDMSQIDSIFIFCGNKKRYEQWAKDWSKIKGVFTEITPICEALKKTAHQCEQNAISISFMPTTGDLSKKNLDQLDSTYMYTQILKEILLSIDFEQKYFQEFIDHCRELFAENPFELKNVNKLQKQYRDKTPIWWYTYECFLYPMLNRSLRLMDVDIIIKMGFFIDDLHRHIEQLHTEQFNNQHVGRIFTVYRGQGMLKTDFEEMAKTKGGLISFNNFLSTSKERDISLAFARSILPDLNMVGILFVMTIDPSKSTTPFASITNVGYYGDTEDEVLFAMHTVFRIGEIKPIDKDHHLFQVCLTLTSDNDKDLCVLTDRIREETFPQDKGWFRLGMLLFKMGQSAKAQQVYEILLEQTNDDNERENIYERLGVAKYHQGEFKEALIFYEKALEIRQRMLPENHLNLSYSYNNIGDAYRNMGDYTKALSSHEKALEIRRKTLPANHPDLAVTYNSIGAVYYVTGEYKKALSSYEKTLAIRQQSLPWNHPDLTVSYSNIGDLYRIIGDYEKALSSHEKALEIRQKTLPPNHPDLAVTHNSIGAVYYVMGEYSKALSSYENALKIRQQSLPSNHPDLTISYNNIGDVYRNMGDYQKALSSHEKALEIRQQTLPPNHPDLAVTHNSIGAVYYVMGEYQKALSSYEKSVEIRQQSLPPNYPDLAMSYGNISLAYENMGDYSKALSFCQRALSIRQESLPKNHPDIQWCRNNLDRIKTKI